MCTYSELDILNLLWSLENFPFLPLSRPWLTVWVSVYLLQISCYEAMPGPTY
jgi:hypothetical protein